MTAILNLGAGNRIIPEAVNHDRVKHRPEIDVAHDLNVLPWPWEAGLFDHIVARAVLEHLDHDLVASMNECWRILRPAGILSLKLPFWRSDNSHNDPTHRWFFALRSLDYFDPDTEIGRRYRFYTEWHWKIIKGPKLNNAETSINWTLRVRK
jgi:predicted SAM-dependent methyltransferase